MDEEECGQSNQVKQSCCTVQMSDTYMNTVNSLKRKEKLLWFKERNRKLSICMFVNMLKKSYKTR